MWRKAIQAQVKTMKIPCRETSLAHWQRGDRPILQYATSGAAPTSPPKGVLTSGGYANSRDALLANSDLLAYKPCHRRDGTAGTPELIYRCYHRRASPLSVTTTGGAAGGWTCLRRRRHPRDSHESAAARMEQLADVSRSDPRPLRLGANHISNELVISFL